MRKEADIADLESRNKIRVAVTASKRHKNFIDVELPGIIIHGWSTVVF